MPSVDTDISEVLGRQGFGETQLVLEVPSHFYCPSVVQSDYQATASQAHNESFPPVHETFVPPKRLLPLDCLSSQGEAQVLEFSGNIILFRKKEGAHTAFVN